jgi:hypothetical protein
MSILAIDKPEEWRPIPGWPEYEVSNTGIVRLAVDGYRKKSGHVLKPWLNRDRLQVELRAQGRRQKFFIHRLVVMAFIGPQPSPAHEVAHWDGNTMNNNLANLRWATPAENAADRERHGNTARGEKSGVTTLTEEDVATIRELCESGSSQRSVGNRFGVSKHAVWCIVNGRTWNHVRRGA